MREIEAMFPHANTVYDYYIEPIKNIWMGWEEKIAQQTAWKPAENVPYHKFLVPTVDSERSKSILVQLLKNKINTLIVGNTGTGKTAVLNGVLQHLESDQDSIYFSLNIVFSA